MNLINLIDGEKGGVGKSFFARVLVQYYIDNQLSYALIDADGANPDVANIYSDCAEKILFSEVNKKAHQADRIFDLAIDKKKPVEAVIVNLPANIFEVVNLWLERNRLLDISLQHGVKFCKWFICSGGFDSVELFKKSVTHHKKKLTHIFVKNMGLTDEWKFLRDDLEFQKLLFDYKQNIILIEFPMCDYYERYQLDKKKIPFSKVMTDDTIPVLSKQRIQYFLEDAYDQINEVLTTPELFMLPQENSYDDGSDEPLDESLDEILNQEEIDNPTVPVEVF